MPNERLTIDLELNNEDFMAKLHDAQKALADGKAPLVRFAVLELVVRFGGKRAEDSEILTLVSNMVKYVTDGTLPE